MASVSSAVLAASTFGLAMSVREACRIVWKFLVMCMAPAAMLVVASPYVFEWLVGMASRVFAWLLDLVWVNLSDWLPGIPEVVLYQARNVIAILDQFVDVWWLLELVMACGTWLVVLRLSIWVFNQVMAFVKSSVLFGRIVAQVGVMIGI